MSDDGPGEKANSSDDQTTLDGDFANVLSRPRADVKTTESQLREWYIEQRLSIAEVADKLDTSQTTVLRLMDEVGIDRRSGVEANKKRLENIRSREYSDPENLRELHHKRGMSVAAIAEKYDMTRNGIKYWFDKHDIDVRSNIYEIPEWTMSPHRDRPRFGYPVWKGCDGDTIPVHILSVIAGGADPHKVFAEEYNVDHLNRHPVDSRPENLELLTRSEHGRREAKRNLEYASDFSKNDLKFAIRFMLNPAKYLDE